MKFIIPMATVKALLLAAAKDDRRYYLNGVCIDVRAHDAVAVATNGHILIAVAIELEPSDDDAPPVPGQYIINRPLLELMKPAYKDAPLSVSIDTTARAVTVNAGGPNTTAPLIDGQFPDWRRVVPRTVSGRPQQLDADYMHAFKKANKLLGAKHSPAVAYNGAEHGDGGPARVLLAGDSVGVIMPFRCDMPSSVDNPSWLETAPAPTTAAA